MNESNYDDNKENTENTLPTEATYKKQIKSRTRTGKYDDHGDDDDGVTPLGGVLASLSLLPSANNHTKNNNNTSTTIVKRNHDHNSTNKEREQDDNDDESIVSSDEEYDSESTESVTSSSHRYNYHQSQPMSPNSNQCASSADSSSAAASSSLESIVSSSSFYSHSSSSMALKRNNQQNQKQILQHKEEPLLCYTTKLFPIVDDNDGGGDGDDDKVANNNNNGSFDLESATNVSSSSKKRKSDIFKSPSQPKQFQQQHQKQQQSNKTIVNDKPPTSHIYYDTTTITTPSSKTGNDNTNTNSHQYFTSPLEYGQSPITMMMKKKMRTKNNVTTTALATITTPSKSLVVSSPSSSSSSSSFVSSPMISDGITTLSSTIDEKDDESSIPIYKPKSRKSKTCKYGEDDDDESFHVDDCDSDDESSADDYSNDHDDDDDDDDYSRTNDASYIIHEPYIPYGRKVTNLNSEEKKFIKEEINDIYDDDIYDDHVELRAHNNSSSGIRIDSDEDTETEDDESHITSNSKVSKNGLGKSFSKELHKGALSKSSIGLQNRSITSSPKNDEEEDDESEVIVEAEVLNSSVAKDDDKVEGDNYSSDSDHIMSDTDSETNASNHEKIQQKVKDNIRLTSKASTTSEKYMSLLERQTSTSSNGIRSKNEGKVKRGKWSLGTRIGEGSFGVVYMGMNQLTGKLMAVKSLNISMSSSNDVIEDLQREIDLMRTFQHDNIVRYIGAEIDTSKNTLFIFQEWVTGGSITSLLKKFGPFPTSVVRSYLHQIFCGLGYLHSNRILHRDIKGGNVLVNDEGIVKLADFGASKQIHVTKNGTVVDMEDMMEQMTMRGTPYFMAIEVFQSTYGPKADVWSAACVAHQMLTALPPWKGMGIQSPTSLFLHLSKSKGLPPLMKQVEGKKNEFVVDKSKSIDPALEELLLNCYERDPMNRPSVQTLLNDKFFAQSVMDESSLYEDESVADLSPLVTISSAMKIQSTISRISPEKLSKINGFDGIEKDVKTTAIPDVTPEDQYDIKDWPSWAKNEV